MLAIQMKTGAQRCSKRECRNSSMMYASVFSCDLTLAITRVGGLDVR